MYQIGVDIGSTYTKYCVMDEKGRIVRLYAEKTPAEQRTYFAEAFSALQRAYPDPRVVSCGYGKANIPAVRHINELTALARGVAGIASEAELILDVGGQDTKIILQKNGSLQEFFINDKCAAGSGIFLANICGMLNIPFSSLDLTDAKAPEIRLSSVCAVFAQSEIVELIAQNVPGRTIVEAVIWQIFQKARPLLDKVRRGDLLLSGGLSAIKGIESYAATALGRPCRTHLYSRYFSAIGAARSAAALA